MGDSMIRLFDPKPGRRADLATYTFDVAGPSRCGIAIWSDRQWAALPESERPDEARRIPDFGWICVAAEPLR